MLWRAFGAPLPGSEIVRNLSENDFCSRTSERAEKTWSKKSGLPCFFSHWHESISWGELERFKVWVQCAGYRAIALRHPFGGDKGINTAEVVRGVKALCTNTNWPM